LQETTNNPKILVSTLLDDSGFDCLDCGERFKTRGDSSQEVLFIALT
jgi:hypothetical protein